MKADWPHHIELEVAALRAENERLMIWQKEAGELIGHQVNEITDLHNENERLRAIVKLIASMPITATAKDFDVLVGAAREALGRSNCH